MGTFPLPISDRCPKPPQHPCSPMQEKLPLKWQTRKADSIPLAWQGEKGKKKNQQTNKPTTEKKEKWCCFQAIYMFISQENVTLYPFFQINFCVTCRIKRVERQELKHREIKDCKPACTEHMFVIYRRQGRGGLESCYVNHCSAAWYVGLISQGLPEVPSSRFFSHPLSGQTKCFPEQAAWAA